MLLSFLRQEIHYSQQKDSYGYSELAMEENNTQRFRYTDTSTNQLKHKSITERNRLTKMSGIDSDGLG